MCFKSPGGVPAGDRGSAGNAEQSAFETLGAGVREVTYFVTAKIVLRDHIYVTLIEISCSTLFLVIVNLLLCLIYVLNAATDMYVPVGKYEVCPEKVQPLLIQRERFAWYLRNLAAKERGLECTCADDDNFTVQVSGGGRRH